MLSISDLKNKEWIKNEILKNLDFVLYNIGFENPNISIHMNNGDKNIKDFPRMFFTLHTLSRLYKYDFVDDELKNKILKLFWELYDLSKEKTTFENMRYVDIYGMRTLKNFNQDYKTLLENFKIGNYASVFSYPIIAFIFISLYNETPELKKEYPYSTSIYNDCLKSFDLWIFSNAKEKYRSFHYSELSLWEKKLPKYLLVESYRIMDDKIEFELERSKIFSSGIAKSLEHFTRIGDIEKTLKIFNFLEKRNYNKLLFYINPVFKKYGKAYTEDDISNLICLDTNTHMIQALLNLYEKVI